SNRIKASKFKKATTIVTQKNRNGNNSERTPHPSSINFMYVESGIEAKRKNAGHQTMLSVFIGWVFHSNLFTICPATTVKRSKIMLAYGSLISASSIASFMQSSQARARSGVIGNGKWRLRKRGWPRSCKYNGGPPKNCVKKSRCLYFVSVRSSGKIGLRSGCFATRL